MPFLPSKKPVTAADFSWNSFPPPPPEADEWTPDPDSVARPGDRPDPRFNRDSYKEETGMYHVPADIATSLRSGASSSAVQGAPSANTDLQSWPPPVPRASGRPREIAAPANVTIEGPPLRAPDHPCLRAPETKNVSTTSEIPVNNVGLGWAAPLEKALAEDIKAPTAGSSALPLDPTAKIYQPQEDRHEMKLRHVLAMAAAEAITQEEDRSSDEALAWEMATTELGVDSHEEGLKLQEEMLQDFNHRSPSPSSSLVLPEGSVSQASSPPGDPKPVAVSRRPHGNHGHWIKTRMVIIMEEDLDLPKRATKRELMAMTDDEINHYLQRVASAHEHWWEAEQRASNGSE